MFEGYTPETVDFLWGIRMNNNREWFLAHKKDYVNHLYEPTKALGSALFQPFLEKSGTLLKVSRIYRDARMHHPLPYKESLWICIRQDVQWWAENPCLYFEINPEGISYGFFFYKPRPFVMEAIRKDIQRDPKAFLEMIRKAEQATGVPITAKNYRYPKPTEDKTLERFFYWKEQIGCVVDEPFSEATFGPELADRVAKFLEPLIPVYEYFCKFRTE